MKFDEKQLKETVWEVMREILAEHNPMPVPAPPAPVMEIVIRSGPPEAVQMVGGNVVQMVGGGRFASCPPPCPPPCCSGMNMLGERSRELLERIKDKTGMAPEDLIQQLELQIRGRLLDEEIERYAKESEIEQSK